MIERTVPSVRDTVLQRRPALLTQDIARWLREQNVYVSDLFPRNKRLESFLTDPDPTLSFRETASFFERAAQLTGDTDFGFKMGMRRDFRLMGLAAYSALSAASLEGFLAALCRNLFSFTQCVELRLSPAGALCLKVSDPTGLPHAQYAEFLSTLLFKSARIYLEPRSGGQVLYAKSVVLDIAEDAILPARHSFWGCPVTVAKNRCEIVFHSSDLGRGLRSSEPYLHKLLDGFALTQKVQDAAEQKALRVRLEEAICAGLSEEKLTQEAVAHKLGMSVRTLSRELKLQNLRFFSVLDDIRWTLAQCYLRDSNISHANVSQLLGYANASSFNEAFRRWAQISPAQFRQEVRISQSQPM